jgi:hypothetical protein
VVVLTLLLALLTPPKHYHFKGLHVLTNHGRSCGADRRLLNEDWRVVIGVNAWVNNVKWDIKASAFNDYALEHKAQPDAYTGMTMYISPSIGYVTLHGITEERKPCHDSVMLVRVK